MSNDDTHIVEPKTYYTVFVVLMVLLVLTVLAAQIEHVVLGIVAAITIAVTKAALIVLYFMHVRYATPLTRVIAVSGFAWLVILLALTLSDVTTRGWDGEKGSERGRPPDATAVPPIA